MDPFLMQICCTIISPTFMSAANFTILGLIIKRLGTQYSWLTPGWCKSHYKILIVYCSMLTLRDQTSSSLLRWTSLRLPFRLLVAPQPVERLQAAMMLTLEHESCCGALSFNLVGYSIPPRASKADYFLVVALTIYVLLGADFIRRYHFDKPVRAVPEASVSTVQEKEAHPLVNKNVKLMLAGLVVNSIFLFIR